jgi:hypothetical protein
LSRRPYSKDWDLRSRNNANRCLSLAVSLPVFCSVILLFQPAARADDPALTVTFSAPPPSVPAQAATTEAATPSPEGVKLPPVTTSPPPVTDGAVPPAPGPAPAAEDPWSVEFELLPEAVRLKWKPIPGAIRYFVEMAADPVLAHRIWVGTAEAPDATAPLHGFIPHGPVYVRIQAVNANAEEVSSVFRPSLLGRQQDLPQGISSITVTTQQAAPTAPARPRRSLQWRPPVLSRELTLIGGKFGGDSYNNYIVQHGLDWTGDSPAMTVSTGARLLYTTNDREGFDLGRGDVNVSTYMNMNFKKFPGYFTYNGYFSRQLQHGGMLNVNNFGLGYTVSPKLSLGSYFTPNPRYMTLWGNYALGGGNLLVQFLDSRYSQSFTLTYQSYQTLR